MNRQTIVVKKEGGLIAGCCGLSCLAILVLVLLSSCAAMVGGYF